MSKNKALDILEGAQPRADGKAQRGPVVIDEDDADWLTRWVKKQRAGKG